MARFSSAFRLSTAVFAALVSTSTIALSQDLRDLSVSQVQTYNAGTVQSGSLSVMTLLDRADATYGIGETVRLAVKANEDAYVTVLNIGASGKVTQLFPNAMQSDNRVKAGETVEIPGKASGAAITVNGPVGAELIKVIATSKPVAVIPASRIQKSGDLFYSLEGDADALNRDLEVVAAKPPEATKIAIASQVIKTVATPVGSAAPAGLLVVPASAVVRPTFPLLLASDKPSYKVGEPITIGVTALQPCHLTVIGRNAAGKAQLLYPTAASTPGPVEALKPTLVSGGPAPQAVIAAAPGVHTVTALCKTQGRADLDARASLEAPSDEEVASLDRDLTVVNNRPKNTTAFATIKFKVER